MKREVRQRCGFGCIFCGIPIYEYEHVEDYVLVREHRPENIVLLCPNHHTEFTRGQRSKIDIENAVRNPHNLAVGSVHHVFHVNRLPYEVMLGTASFEGVVNALVIDNEAILRIEKISPNTGEFGLSALLRDRDHRPVLRINQNEWIASSTEWDVQQVGPRLTIRSARSNILLCIRSDPPSRIAFERGNLFHKGFEVGFDDRGLHFPGKDIRLSNIEFHGARTAIAIRTAGRDDPEGNEEAGSIFMFRYTRPGP